MLLSDADCVTAVVALFIAPLAIPKAPTVLLRDAMSTPSTVPVTVIFPVTSRPAPTSKLPSIST